MRTRGLVLAALVAAVIALATAPSASVDGVISNRPDLVYAQL